MPPGDLNGRDRVSGSDRNENSGWRTTSSTLRFAGLDAEIPDPPAADGFSAGVSAAVPLTEGALERRIYVPNRRCSV
jgi:hypothetical protein